MNLFSRYRLPSLVSFLFFSILVHSQTVSLWLTTGDQSHLLEQQKNIRFAPVAGSNSSSITIDPSVSYQFIDGFGFCLTEGSAEVIGKLREKQQHDLLNDLFNQNTGIGVSVLRISIGASDLSSSDYTYQDGGRNASFSLSGPDQTYLIPVLKRILVINPNIKLLATPWTAPLWMKTDKSWKGGTLDTACYAIYATYFVNYLKAMKAQGISIWAITPQNEPENPGNDPSMTLTSVEEATFIMENLGPALANNEFANIKIIGYDHNCDDPAYPQYVLTHTGSYVEGSAFHLYGGSVTALSQVHNFRPDKSIYFTEQYTGAEGNFSGDFGWHLKHVITGSLNNWSKIALEWNIANDSGMGPRTPGGCTTCQGAYTITNDTSYTRNKSYYIIGQISKFVKPGAVRVSSSSTSSFIVCTALKNPDGSVVVLAYNSSGTAITTRIVNGGLDVEYSIPSESAVTFVWNTIQK